MALGVPQILLALGAGLGERRRDLRKIHTEEKQRQQTYWDANGSNVYNQVKANENLATQAMERLQAAGLSDSNSIQLLEVNGVQAAIDLDKQVQAMKNANDGSYEALLQTNDAGFGKINEIITFDSAFESAEGNTAWNQIIKKQLGFKDLTSTDLENDKGFFNMLKDRITGRDLEDEHNQYMDDDFIGDISIRELREARSRQPSYGDALVYDTGELSPYDTSAAAARIAKTRVTNILADTLNTFDVGGADYNLITTIDSTNDRSEAGQIAFLLKGFDDPDISDEADNSISNQIFIDKLREANEEEAFGPMEALQLGMTFIEFKELIRPEFDKAFSKAMEAGDIPEGTPKEDILQVENSAAIPEDYVGLIFNKKTRQLTIKTAEESVETGGDGSVNSVGPPGSGGSGDEPVAPTEINMLPDASLIVQNPLPEEGGIKAKQKWQKKFRGKYEEDGTAIVVPRRPTTEAEKSLLISEFGFEKSKYDNVNNPDYTLEQIQANWDKKYGKSHDSSGYPLGYTLKTN